MACMVILLHRKKLIHAALSLLAAALLVISGCILYIRISAANNDTSDNGDYIKWVDFKVSYEALDYAMKLDIDTHGKEIELHWIELLAYIAAKNGNDFSSFSTGQMDLVAEKLLSGTSMEELIKNMTYYSYYYESFSAVLSGFLGTYDVEVEDKTAEGGKRWERRYGLISFSPVANGYYYSDCDDFGVDRSYGYARRHLGHDLMGSVGIPIVAVEGGVVEALGWDEFGGWRIGIRSFDHKRYFYYAHLRKDLPYNTSLKVGSVVQPGDVIGYMGRTGYSTTENVNNIVTPHLHFGMELIFDESQKDSDNEIWIDVYNIVQLLYRHRSDVMKIEGTYEYTRVYNIRVVSTE